MKKILLAFLFIGVIIVGGIGFKLISVDNYKKDKEQSVDSTHSEYYVSELSIDDILMYFNEVAFGAEFINGGNPYKIQKWKEPIYYSIYGDYTEKDIMTIECFASWLNTIEGFPGIYETKDIKKTNLNIYFCEQSELISIMGDQFSDADGAVTFYYTDDVIYNAVICYRSDVDQYLRNSVILEEIYNGLGFINDTAIRSDSIIYEEFSTPQNLSQIDELLLKILYNYEIKNGMSVNEVEEIITKLYY